MKIKLMLLAFPIFLLIVPAIAPAQGQTDKVDDYVKAEMQRQRIPGLSIAIVKNGQVIKAKGFGLADVEHNVPATVETIYQSGSLGKQFTATGIMILVEEGKIGLEDKVSKYLGNIPEFWKDITIRHLLTHTSGIKDYDEKDMNYRLDYSDDDLIRIAVSFPSDFTPGTKWNYSNTNYVLLGIIINKVTGKFWGDFLQERLFTPLKMKTARVISEADIIPNRAAGYRLIKGELKNQLYVSPSLNRTADGSLYFSVLDLARWDAALYTENIVKKSSLDLMWTPATIAGGKTYPYGFGWSLARIRDHRIIGHEGGWQGFSSHIARYVDDKLTVIVLTNLISADPRVIGREVAGLYNPELRPIERKAVQVDPKILDQYIGEYEIVPSYTIKITREGNRLMGQPTGEEKMELLAESETSFFIKGAEIGISFVRDERGRVTHLILHEGADTEAKRIK